MAKLMTENKSLAKLHYFSHVSDGFLFQLFRKTHLWGDEPRLVLRRILGRPVSRFTPTKSSRSLRTPSSLTATSPFAG
jgi:hypothetical protein